MAPRRRHLHLPGYCGGDRGPEAAVSLPEGARRQEVADVDSEPAGGDLGVLSPHLLMPVAGSPPRGWSPFRLGPGRASADRDRFPPYPLQRPSVLPVYQQRGCGIPVRAGRWGPCLWQIPEGVGAGWGYGRASTPFYTEETGPETLWGPSEVTALASGCCQCCAWGSFLGHLPLGLLASSVQRSL